MAAFVFMIYVVVFKTKLFLLYTIGDPHEALDTAATHVAEIVAAMRNSTTEGNYTVTDDDNNRYDIDMDSRRIDGDYTCKPGRTKVVQKALCGRYIAVQAVQAEWN